MDKNSRI